MRNVIENVNQSKNKKLTEVFGRHIHKTKTHKKEKNERETNSDSNLKLGNQIKNITNEKSEYENNDKNEFLKPKKVKIKEKQIKKKAKREIKIGVKRKYDDFNDITEIEEASNNIDDDYYVVDELNIDEVNELGNEFKFSNEIKNEEKFKKDNKDQEDNDDCNNNYLSNSKATNAEEYDYKLRSMQRLFKLDRFLFEKPIIKNYYIIFNSFRIDYKIKYYEQLKSRSELRNLTFFGIYDINGQTAGNFRFNEGFEYDGNKTTTKSFDFITRGPKVITPFVGVGFTLSDLYYNITEGENSFLSPNLKLFYQNFLKIKYENKKGSNNDNSHKLTKKERLKEKENNQRLKENNNENNNKNNSGNNNTNNNKNNNENNNEKNKENNNENNNEKNNANNNVNNNKNNNKKVCIWLQGPRGIGKFHVARQLCDDIYFFTGLTDKWKSYNNEDTVISIVYFITKNEDLNYLDKWSNDEPFEVDSKGIKIIPKLKNLIIISNDSFDKIFEGYKEIHEKLKKKFKIIDYRDRSLMHDKILSWLQNPSTIPSLNEQKNMWNEIICKRENE